MEEEFYAAELVLSALDDGKGLGDELIQLHGRPLLEQLRDSGADELRSAVLASVLAAQLLRRDPRA